MSGGLEPHGDMEWASGNGPAATTDDEALLRLALWLAEVSAEAAVAAAAPADGATCGIAAPRRAGEAHARPVGSLAI